MYQVAVVVVGYPAAPLLFARTRFCISAAHKLEDLEEVLKLIEEVSHIANIIYHPRNRDSQRKFDAGGPAPAIMIERTKSKQF